MDITQLPFNKLIGLEFGEYGENGLINQTPSLTLSGAPEHRNHLNTVHASAILALAEAASGQFLLSHFGDMSNVVPVVRRLEAKFRKPAMGRIFSRCTTSLETVTEWKSEFAQRGRLLANVEIEVQDEQGEKILSGNVEWFISKMK
jgi:acyl-coenzyme A thioesterase PaaI-like protein